MKSLKMDKIKYNSASETLVLYDVFSDDSHVVIHFDNDSFSVCKYKDNGIDLIKRYIFNNELIEKLNTSLLRFYTRVIKSKQCNIIGPAMGPTHYGDLIVMVEFNSDFLKIIASNKGENNIVVSLNMNTCKILHSYLNSYLETGRFDDISI